MSDEPAPILPRALSSDALTALAAELAQVEQSRLLKVRIADDDTLVVVVNPGAKFIYTITQVLDAARRIRLAARELAAEVLATDLTPDDSEADAIPQASPKPARARSAKAK